MHICHICHEYPPLARGGGGIGTFLENLANAVVRRGHQMSIAAVGYESQPDATGSLTVIPVPVYRTRWLGVIRTIRQVRRAIDDLHTQMPIDIIEASQADAIMLPSRRDIPCVLRFHGAHSLHSYCRGEKPRIIRGALERRGVRRADFLAAVSNFTADLCRLTLPVAGREIPVLCNGVDTELFAPKPRKVRDSITVLCVGTMNHNKGTGRLVRAFSMIAHRFPQARLRLAGRDTSVRDRHESFLENALKGLPNDIRERIDAMGPIEYSSMPEVYGEADMCVFPSLVENMPVAWIEAMACGKPIVGGCGVASEVIQDRETGLLCDPANEEDIAEKMSTLLSDGDLRNVLGKRAREIAVNRFSTDVTARANDEFYSRCIEDFARGSL